MRPTNAYCEALGIPVPRLGDARKRPDANTYSLLIAALLEHGAPLTLAEAARRFEKAGIAPAGRALASLKRCRPGRPPVYRDGDLYALDPHDDETDLWAFRLGLRPAKAAALRVVRPEPGPLPQPSEPLTPEAVAEAWPQGVPSDWSAQRIAICVLDAHGGVMRPEDVIAFVRQQGHGYGSQLCADSARYWRRDAPIRVREDGQWELDRTHRAVRSAREAARARVASARRWAEQRLDPAVQAATARHFERQRRAHGEQLAGMRRALLHAFPARRPEVLVLLDVNQHTLTTWLGDALAEARERLADYEIIAAEDVRELLRALDFEQGARRLGELGPPQKTRTLSKRGRTLRITTPMLIAGSCNIARPLAAEVVLFRYLREGQLGKLRRRLEADARSLFAYYQFGRLHGAVRLRWGFLDEWIPAPWVHRDEPKLYDLMARAYEEGAALEVVTGNAPGWQEPWARARRVRMVKEQAPGWTMRLLDEEEKWVDEWAVQAARLASSAAMASGAPGPPAPVVPV